MGKSYRILERDETGSVLEKWDMAPYKLFQKPIEFYRKQRDPFHRVFKVPNKILEHGRNSLLNLQNSTKLYSQVITFYQVLQDLEGHKHLGLYAVAMKISLGTQALCEEHGIRQIRLDTMS